MSKYFHINIFSSQGGEEWKLVITKRLFIVIILFFPLISAIGYYLFFSGVLWEKTEHKLYRSKVSQENLKLTRKLISLGQAQREIKLNLTQLHNEKDKTAKYALDKRNEFAGIEEGSIQSFYPSYHPANHEVVYLLAKALQLSTKLDSFLVQLESNPEGISYLPTTRPVSVDSRITRQFGRMLNPFTNRWALHPGVDFSGKQDDWVLAAGSGLVKDAGTDVFYGKYVRIHHSRHIETFYAHLDSYRVSAGQSVKRGDEIGKIGQTGFTTSSHLHFEVLVNGEKLNPMDFFLDPPEFSQ